MSFFDSIFLRPRQVHTSPWQRFHTLHREFDRMFESDWLDDDVFHFGFAPRGYRSLFTSPFSLLDITFPSKTAAPLAIPNERSASSTPVANAAESAPSAAAPEPAAPAPTAPATDSTAPATPAAPVVLSDENPSTSSKPEAAAEPARPASERTVATRQPSLFFGGWHAVPKVEVNKTEDGSLSVRTSALPEGVTKDDLSIELNPETNMLTIKGEKTTEATSENTGTRKSYWSFQRSMALPKGVDPSTLSASFKDGTLQLVIPASALPTPTPAASIPVN